MQLIKPFKLINAKSVPEAGGKGASLGEMTSAGIPVPPGFVILSSAFDRFLDEEEIRADIDAILGRVNYKDVNSVDRASNEIRGVIANEEMPDDLKQAIFVHFKKLKAPLVAVRSSATAEDSKTASWAGELETYLNTDSRRLLENVKKCWSSLFTPRAIFYRHEKRLLKKRVSVAVVVQEMVQSEISGITFTVHPVTEDRNQMLIEAGWGLGEAIVSGMITPDSYVIDKKSLEILEVSVSEQLTAIVRSPTGTKEIKVSKKDVNKQKLVGKRIFEIAKLCSRVEKHYGFPCDIEWAFAKSKFYITQSRPITTLK